MDPSLADDNSLLEITSWSVWRTPGVLSLYHSVGRLPEYRERGICTRTGQAHIEGMHCQAQCSDRDQRGSMFSLIVDGFERHGGFPLTVKS